jgi:hypothetical protein
MVRRSNEFRDVCIQQHISNTLATHCPGMSAYSKNDARVKGSLSLSLSRSHTHTHRQTDRQTGRHTHVANMHGGRGKDGEGERDM